MKTETRRKGSPTLGFETYLQDIDETSLLSAQDERDLADRIAAGDPAARDHLVRANLRLVVKIAREFQGRRLPLEDLIAEGNLGLMRAVEGFDGGRDTRFSTYASYWIKQSIRRAVMNQSQSLRLPAYIVTALAKWRRATAVLTERLGRAPTAEEIGAALRLRKKRMAIVVQAMRVRELMVSHEVLNEDESSSGSPPRRAKQGRRRLGGGRRRLGSDLSEA